MSRLVFNVNTEIQALYAMCSPKDELRGACASLVIKDFATETGIEIAKFVFRSLSKTGKAPVWGALLESPKLSEETRETIQGFDSLPRKVDQVIAVVSNIVEMRKVRTVQDAAKSALAALNNEEEDIDAIIAKLQRSTGDASASHALRGLVVASGSADNDAARKLVHKIIHDPDKDFFIPTGFNTFDSVNAGLPRGGTFLLGATSGGGKSHVIGQMGINQAMMGYRIVVLPLEMDVNELITRNLANISSIDSLKILKGVLSDAEKTKVEKRWSKFQTMVREAGGDLHYAQPEGHSLSLLEVLNYATAQNPDVLYIDYAGLLDEASDDKQWQSLGNMIRMGKMWAGSNKRKPCFATAVQVDDDTSKIRYSQMMKENASLAWAATVTDKTKEDGVIPFRMLKGRNQMFIPITLGIDYPTSRVFDLDSDDPKLETYNRERKELPKPGEAKKDAGDIGKKVKAPAKRKPLSMD